MSQKIIVVLSGGLDSTILLYHLIYNLKYNKQDIIAVSYKLQNEYIMNNDADNCLYQNNYVELQYAQKTTQKLNVKHIIIDLTYLNEILNIMRTDLRFNSFSKLKNKEETCMPFRNLIMLSNALSFAQALGASKIYLGYQQQDQYGYWDTKKEFLEAVSQVAKLNPDCSIEIHTPFLKYDKKTEIEIALKIGVPLEDTWTCYNPLKKNKDDNVFYSCGKCKACKERLSNFEKLNIKDKQLYWED